MTPFSQNRFSTVLIALEAGTHKPEQTRNVGITASAAFAVLVVQVFAIEGHVLRGVLVCDLHEIMMIATLY